MENLQTDVRVYISVLGSTWSEVTYVWSEVTYLMERTNFRVEQSDFGMERSDLERSNHGAI